MEQFEGMEELEALSDFTGSEDFSPLSEFDMPQFPTQEDIDEINGMPEAYDPPAPFVVPISTKQKNTSELIASMPYQKEALYAILDFCREMRTSDEVDEMLADILKYRQSVFTPAKMRQLLQNAGGLEYIEAEEEADEDETTEEYASSEEGAAGIGSEVDADGDTAIAASEAPEADDEILTDEYGNLVLPKEKPGWWLTTEEGLKAVAENNPADEFAALLEDNVDRVEVFRAVLAFCAEKGRSISEIGTLVNGMDYARKDTAEAGFFVSTLEDVRAITWRGAWVTTDLGKTFLD